MVTRFRFLSIPLLALSLTLFGCSAAKNTQTETTQKEEKKEDNEQTPPTMVDDSHMAPDNNAPRTPSESGRTASEGPMDAPRTLPGNNTGGSLPSEAPATVPSIAPHPSSNVRTRLPSEEEGGQQTPSEPVNGQMVTAQTVLRSEPGLEQVVVEEMPDRCIRLTGRVKTSEKKMQAASLVRAATGVECVKNEIQVAK